MIVSICLSRKNDVKRFNALKYCLPKAIIKNCNVIINGRNVYDQPVDSGIKWHKEIRNLIIGQGEDYTTGCFLDSEYIKNHCSLIALDLSRQK